MKLRLAPAAGRLPAADLAVSLVIDDSSPRGHRDLAASLAAARKTGDLKVEYRRVATFHTGVKAWPRLLTVGLGKAKAVTVDRIRRVAAVAQAHAERAEVKSFVLALGDAPGDLAAEDVGRAVAEGILLGAHRHEAPRREKAKARFAQQATVAFAGKDRAAFARGFAAGQLAAGAVAFARDLENAPANLVTPQRLAAEARRLARPGLRVNVLEAAAMRRLKMGALLGVAQGSALPPKLIALDYRPAGAKETICVVGKGLTFDSGGISIKPAAKMDEMRYDMCGAGAVLGLFHALAAGALKGSKRKVRVVGVIPAAENMPSGTAQRPGDVVRAFDGHTIEILNTDAEGRLALADAIGWAKKTFAPDRIVDLATLTGAVITALGHEVAAVMGNDQKLIDELIAAGKAADEPLWQLPLWDVHKQQTKSKFADLANLASPAAGAGTIAGAAFLSYFAGDVPWAHIDIAGTAWGAEAKDYYTSGATGTAVRMLLRWLGA